MNAVTQEGSSVKPCEDFEDMKPRQALRAINPFHRLTERVWLGESPAAAGTGRGRLGIPLSPVLSLRALLPVHKRENTPCGTLFLRRQIFPSVDIKENMAI